MDIKDLSRSQFILLLILLSFVVSIATSITTYALLDKAPDNVKRPITQVVQKTVERIVEVEKGQSLSADDLKLIEDLKALKPLIDKLAEETTPKPDSGNIDTNPKDVVQDGTKEPAQDSSTTTPENKPQ